MKINKQIQITGKVQGVFFRKSTQEKAKQMSIKGWVRNKPDGSVLTEIEGSPQAVEKMEIWLHIGPERAIVEKITVQDGEVKDYEDFEVLVDR